MMITSEFTSDEYQALLRTAFKMLVVMDLAHEPRGHDHGAGYEWAWQIGEREWVAIERVSTYLGDPPPELRGGDPASVAACIVALALRARSKAGSKIGYTHPFSEFVEALAESVLESTAMTS